MLLGAVVRQRFAAYEDVEVSALEVALAENGSLLAWFPVKDAPRAASFLHQALGGVVPPVHEVMELLAQLEAVLCSTVAPGCKKLGDAVRAIPDEGARAICVHLFGFEGLNVRNILAHGFCTQLPLRLAVLVAVIARTLLRQFAHAQIDYAPLFQDATVSLPDSCDSCPEALHLARKGEHRSALFLAFAHLENRLREVYCPENGCEAQLQLATERRLFLTLDILLGSELRIPSVLSSVAAEEGGDVSDESDDGGRGERNRVFDNTSKEWALEVMDVFIWSPVRLRDILFHGRCDPRQELAGECARALRLCGGEAVLGCPNHPMRRLAEELRLSDVEWEVLPTVAQLRRWSIWSSIVDNVSETAKLLDVTSESLARRAAARANKRKAAAQFEEHRGMFADFEILVKDAAKRAVVRQEDDGDATLLFQTSGAVLGSLKRNESLKALHYLAAFFGVPDKLGPSLLSRTELASVTRQK
jgi:hypothetical protein